MRRAVVFALAALTACGGGGTSAVPRPTIALDAPAAQDAPEVRSANGVVALELRAAIDPATGLPAFFWNGRAVAPTIRVDPGDHIRIRYRNDLPSDPGKDLTNLHFHGLTTSPQAPADDVLDIALKPGESYQYDVPVGTDQPPGTYWYHPHAHGSTQYQVGSGMSGAIIVNGIAADVPALTGARERVLVLRDTFTSTSAARATLAFCGVSAQRLAQDARLRAFVADARRSIRAAGGTAVTVNGLPQAAITIAKGETQLLHVLNAAPNRYFDLAVDGSPITLVGEDGVPLHAYPGGPATRNVDHVLLPPGARADIAITGTGYPAVLRSRTIDTGPSGDPNPELALALITPGIGGASSARVPAVRAVTSYRAPLPAPVADRTIHLTEDPAGKAFSIDGVRFDPQAPPRIVARIGTVERWTVENDTLERHAFHVHQAHAVIDGAADPNWLDTIDVPPAGAGFHGDIHPSTVTILVDFRDPALAGTFVYHCHFLEHEDGGMMAKVTVR